MAHKICRDLSIADLGSQSSSYFNVALIVGGHCG